MTYRRKKTTSPDPEVIKFFGILVLIAFAISHPEILIFLIVIVITIVIAKTGQKQNDKNTTQKYDYSKSNENKSHYENKSYNQNKSKQNKGDDFENFVASQFSNNDDYTVISWTGDKMRKYNVYVESDSGPDLKIRHEPTKEEFYIECKYRSDLFKGKYKWTNDAQRKRYLDFASKNAEPFYVVMGLGGSPNKPDDLYCVPLREAKYVGLYPVVFEKYYHDPNMELFWKNGVLR